jgi:hypothetical protein
VAGLPVFTDNHVRQQIVEALRSRGWDVVRAIDAFPPGTDDEALMVHAAEQGRVFLTNDVGIHAIAHRWLAEGRAFRMIYWKAKLLWDMSDGDIVHGLEEIAAKPDAFAYSIEYIHKPKR